MGNPIDTKILLDRLDKTGRYGWVDFPIKQIKGSTIPFDYKCKICGYTQTHSIKRLIKNDIICKQCKFINDSKTIWGDKYDYSKLVYKSMRSDVTIICPEHGLNTMRGYYHHKRGCKECHNKRILDRDKNKNEFFYNDYLKRFKLRHGDKYDYSKFEYKGCDTEVEFICPEHGSFFQTPKCHTRSGCFQCGLNSNIKGGEEFMSEYLDYHGEKYDYPCIPENLRSTDEITIICPEHGEFIQNAYTHTKHGCPKCAIELGRLSIEEMERRLIEHPMSNLLKYDFSGVTSTSDVMEIECPIHGVVGTKVIDFINRGRCPKCSISNGQLSVQQFLDSIGVKYNFNNRKILGNGLEIDIVVEDHKLGIEYNGIYHHSETKGGKSKKYHLDKLLRAFNNGYDLIHISEVEWYQKRDIIKSLIKGKLGLLRNRVYARETEVVEISDKVFKEFVNNNHLQGYVSSKIRLGLFKGNELVSVMSFGKSRYSKDSDVDFELYRLCNKIDTNVVGGSSKLFKHFVKKFNPNAIVSYCDISHFKGDVYTKLGFYKSHRSEPNYKYFKTKGYCYKTQPLESRVKYQKSKLIKIFGEENVDMELSEYQNMLNNNRDRIWDCGNDVYIWKSKNFDKNVGGVFV